MATTNKKNNTTIIDLAASIAMATATKANNIALETTEKVFNKSFKMAEKCISFNGKILKKGLQFTAMQQEMTFNTLESLKKKIVKK